MPVRTYLVERPVPVPAENRRGCGYRIAGGVYWMTGIVPLGLRIENFIVDPPVPVDVGALGLVAIGQKTIVRNGVTHVLDWVGEGHYPYPADFVEEARRMGVSRRMARNFPWERLTNESRLLLVHRHAYVTNWREVRPLTNGGYACPRGHREHQFATTGPCAGLWWESIPAQHTERSGRAYGRRMPNGIEYVVRWGPTAVIETQPAIFMSVPLNRVEVVADMQAVERTSALIRHIQQTNGNRYPVSLVNE